MDRELARKVADAVLYEGYMLYPYSPSALKNQQRWLFGTLYPPSYPEVLNGSERSIMHAECLVRIQGSLDLHVELRFLHLSGRQVERFLNGQFNPVPSLRVDDRVIEPWDDAVERSAEILLSQSERQFGFPSSRESEEFRNGSGALVGRLTRDQQSLTGSLILRTEPILDKVAKITIEAANTTVSSTSVMERKFALLQSMLSAQMVLTARNCEFISLLDPPEDCREAVAACNNVGNFPVLIGQEGDRDMMLCSPMILYDYPQVAPESAGDFYDSTEMDEMLTLRVTTLTDQEKREMLTGEDRIRNLLQRTEEGARRQLQRTHGVIRSLRPLYPGEKS